MDSFQDDLPQDIISEDIESEINDMLHVPDLLKELELQEKVCYRLTFVYLFLT